VIRFLRDLLIDARPYMTHAEARARMAKLMADSAKPRVIYADHAQRELRHAPPTICGKCGDLAGYNDGVQPCNACFVAGMESAYEIVHAVEKVTKFPARGVR
jgi:hypothetical protein